MNPTRKRKLSAILFADIVGYTAMMHEDERFAMNRLKHYQHILKQKVAEHEGDIIKNYGDGSLCLFSSVFDAVQCAKDVQLVFQQHPVVPLRIGLHIGDVIYQENDIYGDALNIVSRIESMGIPGSVLLSKDVHDKIKNHKNFRFSSLGHYSFKNVTIPMEVYALSNEGLKIPTISPVMGKARSVTKRPVYKKPIFISFIVVMTIFLTIYANNSLGLFSTSLGTTETTEINQAKTIAVLPLVNLNSKDENLDFFAQGVSQEIIDELAHINAFKVTAFTQSSYYSNQNLAPVEIADKLQVNYLMTGTVRLTNHEKRVKLSIEVFDPRNNELSWNTTFDEDIDDISFIQNSIANQVSQIMNVNLNESELASINELKTTNGHAFKLYLKAKYEMNNMTEEGFNNAQSLLDEAISIDPNFSSALILYAWTFILGMESHWTADMPSSKAIREFALPLLENAIKLEPNNSDAFLVRGGLKLLYDNNIQEAKKDIDHALTLNSWPKIPTDYCMCTAVSTYVALNNIIKASEILELAQKIDPSNDLLNWDKGNVYMISGKYKKAASTYNIAYQNTQIPNYAMFVGFAWYHSGEFEEALKNLNLPIENNAKATGFPIAYLSATHFKNGNLALSNDYKIQLEQRMFEGELHLNWPLAIVYMSRDEYDIALDYLEKSIDLNESDFALFTSLDPIFDPLENNPRFIEIKKRINYFNPEFGTE